MTGILMDGHLEHITFASSLLILYLALVSAVAYTLWSVLLTYNPVSKVASNGLQGATSGIKKQVV